MEEDQGSWAPPLAVYGAVWDGGEYNLYITSSVVDAVGGDGGGDAAGRAAPSLSCGVVLVTDHYYDTAVTPPRSHYDAVHLLLQRYGEIDDAVAADVSEETVYAVEAATQPTGLPFEATYDLWETLREYIADAAADAAVNRSNNDVLPTNGTTPTTALAVNATIVYRAALEEEEEEDDEGDDDVRSDIGDGEDEETGTREEEKDVELLLSAAAENSGSIDGEEDVCAVCLEKMTGGDHKRGLPCSHWFHGGCIARWLRRKLQCPLCRRHVGEPTEV